MKTDINLCGIIVPKQHDKGEIVLTLLKGVLEPIGCGGTIEETYP